MDSPAIVYLMQLAPSSRPTQANALRRAAEAFGVHVSEVRWHEIDYAQMAILRAWVAEPTRYAPASANKILMAVKAVLACCVKMKAMSRDAFEDAKVARVHGRREVAGRALEAHEMRALFGAAAAVGGHLGARHAATLALCYGCGLRRAEAVSLRFEQFDRGAKTVRLVGKGNVERLIPVPDGAVRAIDAWIAYRGREPGFLLCSIARAPWRPMVRHRMEPSSIYKVIETLARRAGIGHLSPHDLRRTYLGDLLDAGADLATAQALAGHVEPGTTARYDRRPLRARADAVAKLVVPFDGGAADHPR